LQQAGHPDGKVEAEDEVSLALPGSDTRDIKVDLSSHTEDNEPAQNHYEGIEMAKQLSESVSDFLARLPPSTTSVSSGGPWIWIANPYPNASRSGYQKRNSPRAPETDASGGRDIATFRQLGSRMLDDYRSRQDELAARMPERHPGAITRMMRPDRVRLESGIRDLARQKGVTCGKWMLFPSPHEVDAVWEQVARGTWEGRLGIAAKVATAVELPGDGGGGEADSYKSKGKEKDRDTGWGQTRLICVYTSDFADKEDVKRVLLGIKQLGLLDQDVHGQDRGRGPARHFANDNDSDNDSSGGGGGGPAILKKATASLKTIYYKCDAYTYLDITSGNEFKLKASMYSSRDLLAER
jgi:hypothetical protein